MNIVEFISKVIKKISSSVFRLLGRDSLTFVKIFPRKDLLELGTKYGGWVIPVGLLSSDSVCYLVGCGEDISFDIALIDKIGCDVFGFDPTPRAIQYVRRIAGNNSKYHFNEVGLWDKDDDLKFYAPKISDHVSHSIVTNDRGQKIILQLKCVG